MTGNGTLKLDDGTVLLPNEHYPLEKELFRLYFTSLSDEQSSLKVWVEDTFGQMVEVEFSFNNDIRKKRERDSSDGVFEIFGKQRE